MGKILDVRRARAVVWLSDEMMAASEDGGRSEAEAVMRVKVNSMVREAIDDGEVRLVSIEKLEPHDPEFADMAAQKGYIPEGCSPWISEWEVVG